MKRTLILLLACILLLGSFFVGSAVSAAEVPYQNNDVIEFGSYPQSLVTDEEILAALNSLPLEWKSYGYYSRAYGNEPNYDVDYLMRQSDFMQYTDVTFGSVKYRGVRFRAFRPDYSCDGATTLNDWQTYFNGFKCDTEYWFEWQPIRWNVLDAQSGLVFAQNVVDAQAFNPFYYISPDNVWYRDKTCTDYASAYSASFIRHWLTDREQENGFAREAFSDYQWSCIRSTQLDNHAVEEQYLPYAGEDTEDRVYLMSAYEVCGVTRADRQVDVFDPAEWNIKQRNAPATDYARCQGATCRTVNGQPMGTWITRTIGQRWIGSRNGQPHYAPTCAECWNSVSFDGTRVDRTDGIRPALRIDPALLQSGDLTEPPTPTSGICGENVQWAFDEETGVLLLSGTGTMYSLDTFADYGYWIWKEDIQFVVAADGVTSIGAHAFEGCTVLEEAILPHSLTAIGEDAFADCPRLLNVMTMSNVLSAPDAFPDDRTDWTLIAPILNTDAVAIQRRYGIPLIMFSYFDSMLSFSGDIVVRDGAAYSYLPTLIQYFDDATQIYFDRLVFADMQLRPGTGQDFLTEYDGHLAMEQVKVSLVYISPDGNPEDVTYARMLELLQSGDYSAFKLRVIVSENEPIEETIVRKIVEIFPNMPKKVLRLVSKAINFIVNIFKKK